MKSNKDQINRSTWEYQIYLMKLLKMLNEGLFKTLVLFGLIISLNISEQFWLEGLKNFKLVTQLKKGFANKLSNSSCRLKIWASKQKMSLKFLPYGNLAIKT